MSLVRYSISQDDLAGLCSGRSPLPRTFNKRVDFVAHDGWDIFQCIAFYSRERGFTFPPQREDTLDFNARNVEIVLENTFVTGNERLRVLRVQVLPDVSFLVHSNAWSSFQNFARGDRSLFRGGLYKCDTGNTAYSQYFFLDRKIMDALRDHDLGQYEEQMQSGMRDDRRAMALLERERLMSPRED